MEVNVSLKGLKICKPLSPLTSFFLYFEIKQDPPGNVIEGSVGIKYETSDTTMDGFFPKLLISVKNKLQKSNYFKFSAKQFKYNHKLL